MSKGYYYSRDEYIKKLEEENRFKDIYKRKMKDVGSSNAVTQPDIVSLENLLNDKPALKKLILGELRKFMLSQDAEKAVSYLDNNNQLEEYIQTSNAFQKYIGNPILYKYSNFVNSWNQFNKSMGKMLPSSSPEIAKFNTDTFDFRKIAEDSALAENKNLVSEAIDKAYDIRQKEFLNKTERTLEDMIADEENKYKDLMGVLKPAEIRVLEERNKELRRIANEGYVKSFKTSKPEDEDEDTTSVFTTSSTIGPVSSHTDEENRKFLALFSKAKMLYDTIEPGKQSKMINEFTNENLSKSLSKFFNNKSLKRLKSKELIYPEIDKAINLLNPSGSGLKRRKTTTRKPSKTYEKILKGEIAAGNNNKAIKNKLKKLGFK